MVLGLRWLWKIKLMYFQNTCTLCIQVIRYPPDQLRQVQCMELGVYASDNGLPLCGDHDYHNKDA